MSTHNIGFDLTKNIFQLSSNTHLISSSAFYKPTFFSFQSWNLHLSTDFNECYHESFVLKIICKEQMNRVVGKLVVRFYSL